MFGKLYVPVINSSVRSTSTASRHSKIKCSTVASPTSNIYTTKGLVSHNQRWISALSGPGFKNICRQTPVFKSAFFAHHNLGNKYYSQQVVAKSLPVFDGLDFSSLTEQPINPPTSFEVPVYNLSNEVVGTVNLPEYIFGTSVRIDILHRVVTWQRACKRKGTASTKTRSEVNYSTRKLYKQKGNGRARVGSRGSPIRIGGGVAHGPKPRDYSYTLPKKIRTFGLRCALASKFAKNNLYIIDSTNMEAPKTKVASAMAKSFGWNETGVLIVDGDIIDPNFQKSVQNLENVKVISQKRLNVYDILRAKKLALSKQVLPYLTQRLQNPLEDVYETQNTTTQ